MNPFVCTCSASGEVNNDIVVEMKSSEKPNEESGLLNKPHVEQVRGQRSMSITLIESFGSVYVLSYCLVPWELK